MYETRDMNSMQDTLANYECLITRPHLNDLACLSPLSPCCSSEKIQIIHVKILSKQDHYEPFAYILNALGAINQTFGVLLLSHNSTISLYLFIKGNCSFALPLLENSLSQLFPESMFYIIDSPDKFLDNLFNPKNYKCISSCLTVPNTTYSSPPLISLTSLMGTTSEYAAFFLAEPVSKCCIHSTLKDFYSMYNTLSNFTLTNYTHYKSNSKCNTFSCAESNVSSMSKTDTNTCGESCSTSNNSYINVSASTPISFIAQKNRSNIQAPAKDISIDTAKSDSTNSCTSGTNAFRNINSTILINKAKGSSETTNSSNSCAQACSDSQTNTSTKSNSSTNTIYEAHSFSCANKYMQEATESLNQAIIRYNALSKNQVFNFSSYFFSSSSAISYQASYLYLGLIQSSYTLSPNIVSSWLSDNPYYPLIFNCLRQLSSPCFEGTTNCPTISNSLPILSSELVHSIYYPVL